MHAEMQIFFDREVVTLINRSFLIKPRHNDLYLVDSPIYWCF